MTSLRLTEIFYSLQGEGKFSGIPTVFVRLTGCPLRCSYCDTAYAFDGGKIYMQDQILEEVGQYDCKYVCVTGGEPLAQKACTELLSNLCDKGYEVSLETSGAIPIEGIDARVCIVMDLKTPSSNEEHRNLYDNIEFLQSKDQIKFVIENKDDYLWSKEQLAKYRLNERVGEVLFSPVYSKLDYQGLSEWILEDKLPVRMQIQLHKLIWHDQPGH